MRSAVETGLEVQVGTGVGRSGATLDWGLVEDEAEAEKEGRDGSEAAVMGLNFEACEGGSRGAGCSGGGGGGGGGEAGGRLEGDRGGCGDRLRGGDLDVLYSDRLGLFGSGDLSLDGAALLECRDGLGETERRF